MSLLRSVGRLVGRSFIRSYDWHFQWFSLKRNCTEWMDTLSHPTQPFILCKPNTSFCYFDWEVRIFRVRFKLENRATAAFEPQKVKYSSILPFQYTFLLLFRPSTAFQLFANELKYEKRSETF